MAFGSHFSAPAVRLARRQIRSADAGVVREQVELVQIPAPPLGEAERARAVAERFEAVTGARVETDEAGNVLAHLAGTEASAAPVVVAAHLDTVFPAGTELAVRRERGRIYAPGITDNARGLAALLALCRLLAASPLRTHRPLVFAATVGEEGIGDLRGVKHLFRDGAALRNAHAFVALDGCGSRRIVHRSVGSLRLRVDVHGPGGHSWSDRGRANPVAVVAKLAADIGALPLPHAVPSAAAATRIGGGTSINAIPADAWLEVDLRSATADTLTWLGRRVRDLAHEALAAENSRSRQHPDLTMGIREIGNRPAGITPPDGLLVRAALEATREIGTRPELVASSTDANVPMSLGIPAIAMGAGGEGGGIHTLGEWYGTRNGASGLERVLLTVLAVAGV